MLKVNEVFYSLQGEGNFMGTPSIFVRFSGCNRRCWFCFPKGHRVLMSDRSWKDISELNIGDITLGVGSDNRLVESPVTKTLTRKSEVGVASFKSGKRLIVTPDHRFYYHSSRKREISRLVGKKIRTVGNNIRVFNISDDWKRGWLAGVIEGDGCIWTLKGKNVRRIRLFLRDTECLETFKAYAADVGFDFRWGTHQFTGFLGPETVSCLWLTRHKAAVRFETELINGTKSLDWYYGWLGGITDAEGSKGNLLRINQTSVNPGIREKICEYLSCIGAAYTVESAAIRGTKKRQLQALLEYKYQIKRKYQSILHHKVFGEDYCTNFEPLAKEQVVYNISTATGNYIVEGFLVSNCDTDHEAGTEMVPEAVIELIEKLPSNAHIVFTGGEPLIQNQNEFIKVIRAFMHRNITFETNGDGKFFDYARWVADNLSKRFLSFSFKEHTPAETLRVAALLDDVKHSGFNYWVKLVTPKDAWMPVVAFAEELCKHGHGLSIILQTESSTTTVKDLVGAVPTTNLPGVRMLPQLHKLLDLK